MAASLSIFTGHPNAWLKSIFIHPPPRLWGSRRGCPLMIGPGYPKATRSNFQSLTHSLTTRTILPAVIVGPEGILRGSFCPVASSLMFVPPTSTTRTLGAFAARPFFPIVLLWFHERMVFAPPSASEFQNRGDRREFIQVLRKRG